MRVAATILVLSLVFCCSCHSQTFIGDENPPQPDKIVANFPFPTEEEHDDDGEREEPTKTKTSDHTSFLTANLPHPENKQRHRGSKQEAMATVERYLEDVAREEGTAANMHRRFCLLSAEMLGTPQERRAIRAVVDVMKGILAEDENNALSFPNVGMIVGSYEVGKLTAAGRVHDNTHCQRLFPHYSSHVHPLTHEQHLAGEHWHHHIKPPNRPHPNYQQPQKEEEEVQIEGRNRVKCSAVRNVCPGIIITCSFCSVLAPTKCTIICPMATLYCGSATYSCMYLVHPNNATSSTTASTTTTTTGSSTTRAPSTVATTGTRRPSSSGRTVAEEYYDNYYDEDSH